MINTESQKLIRVVSPYQNEQKAVTKNLPKFILNEIVNGTVLKSYSARSALILIKGEAVHVKTHIPLKAGAIITLKADKITPETVLKLMAPDVSGTEKIKISNILLAMKENLWKIIHEKTIDSDLIREDKSRIYELMRDIFSRIYEETTAILLKNVINKTGLNWESSLAKMYQNKNISKDSLDRSVENDLKGLLTKVLMQTDDDDIHLKRMQTVIKSIQLLNQHILKQDGKIFLPIPIQYPDGFYAIGQLLLHFTPWEQEISRNTAVDDRIYKISFVIELSQLGPIRADFVIQAKRIDGLFLIAEQQTKDVVESALPKLVNVLQEKGYSIDAIKCILESHDIINRSLLNEVFYDGDYSVCLVA